MTSRRDAINELKFLFHVGVQIRGPAHVIDDRTPILEKNTIWSSTIRHGQSHHVIFPVASSVLHKEKICNKKNNIVRSDHVVLWNIVFYFYTRTLIDKLSAPSCPPGELT